MLYASVYDFCSDIHLELVMAIRALTTGSLTENESLYRDPSSNQINKEAI